METAEDIDVKIDEEAVEETVLNASVVETQHKTVGDLIDLTTDEEARLKTFLKKNIQSWIEDTSDLHQRLQDDNDLVEGIIMETDFPWVGCSNIHSPLTEIYMDGYRSIIKRSILGAGAIWVAETDIDELMASVADIEEMLDYKARNEWNIVQALDGVIWTTERDGLGVIKCPYVEEYETSSDVAVITSEAEFLLEFPTPEEAGVDEEEWIALRAKCSGATEEIPVEIPITFEKLIYKGPYAEIVDLVNFVTFPASAPDIKSKSCRGYGMRFPYHVEEIREKIKNKVFYKEPSERVIKGNKDSKISAYVQAKDEIAGIKRTGNKDERELYELVIKGRLKGDDDDVKKYLVTYSYECDEVVSAMAYPYRRDFYALFRIDARPNQLVGKNIPAKTRDLNDLSDTLLNQEVNTRTISTVPVFKAQKDAKEELDPELSANKFRPGMILWLSDFDLVDQFKIGKPEDHAGSKFIG